MSDDEGFTSEIKTEMIDLNFIPLFPPKKFKPKARPHRLKPNHQSYEIYESPFIDKNLQEELCDKFMSANQEKIVFSSNSNVEVAQSAGLSFESEFESGNLEFVVY